MAIHNCHDFHAFSALCGSDLCPAAFRHNEGSVNEAFFFIECTSVAKFVGNIRQHSTQNFIAAPSLKAPMYGFVVRIALRQHVPLRTGVENPQHRFKDTTRGNRLSTRTPIRNVFFRKMIPDAFPPMALSRQVTRNANNRSKVSVGTTHISIAAITSMWFRRGAAPLSMFCPPPASAPRP